MDKRKPEYMTAEDLRNRLYHSLRDRGLVDSIKSQLRNNIVSELQQTTQGQLSSREVHVPEEGSLLHRASNSLVSDHLRRCKYEYSLSVFLPESGTARDKIFTTHDLLQLLGISPQSRLYKKMAYGQADSTKKGFLWQLLSEVSALHSNSVQECGVQTDLIKVGTISSLDEKLVGVDDFYSSKKDECFRLGATAMEDRLMSFQRQLEERYRTDLKLEVARIKDNEAARIRLEEKENCRREFDQLRRELERTYQQKSDAMLQKERNSIERMQKEQEIHEKEIFAQRQSILQEIESIRKREGDVKRESDINHREKKLNEQRIKDKEDDLRRREQDVLRKEAEYQQRLQNEMTKFKVEQQAKFLERTQNLEIREARVKDEERRVKDDQDRIQGVKDDLKDKTIRITELETRVQEEKHGEVSAMRQIELLNAKLRDMADYNVLKEQNIVQRNELETLRTRLAEVLQMNERERGRQEEMMRELRRPTPESLMLQRDLEKAKESLRQEQTLGSASRQQLEKRLQEEMDRNRDLLRRFEEQTIQMKEMNQELVDLRAQLSITHQALNNEVYRKPQDQDNVNRSVSFQTSRRAAPAVDSGEEDINLDNDFKSLPGQDFASRSPTTKRRPRYDDNDVYNDIEIEYDLPPGNRRRLYPAFSEDDISSTNSADIVAEAKYRLKSLEREAQNLEVAYRDFHYNLTNPASGPEERSSHRKSIRDIDIAPEKSRSSSHNMVPSPKASPIHRPMSSTPYKSRQTGALDDSLNELTGSAASERKEKPLKFDLSNMSDDGKKDERVEDRPRPITVSDLEARPGSPSIVVVPGSRSSDDEKSPALHGIRDFDTTPKRPPTGGKLAPISLDSAWKTPSLEDNWKSPALESKPKEKVIKEETVEEDYDKWEEERKKKEDERKRKLEEAKEREKRELMQLEGGAAVDEEVVEEVKSEASKKEKDDGIDPVMKQYMEMVQKQKEKETEMAKKTVDIWAKGHSTDGGQDSLSASELSVAEEIHSKNGSGDDFDW